MSNIVKSKGFKLVTGTLEMFSRVEKVSEIWGDIAEKVHQETGVYVSAIVSEGRAVYSHQWGCPAGGETVFIISGEANSKFTRNLSEWCVAVEKCTNELKKQLNQDTITLSIYNTALLYLE